MPALLDGEPIYPTHSCFDDALDFIERRIKQDRSSGCRLILVHAIALAPEGSKQGQPFAHAWVEEGDLVWQDGIVNGNRVTYCTARDEYLRVMRIQESTRYTVPQLLRENARTGTYGPWEPQYIALCNENPNAPTLFDGTYRLETGRVNE